MVRYLQSVHSVLERVAQALDEYVQQQQTSSQISNHTGILNLTGRPYMTASLPLQEDDHRGCGMSLKADIGVTQPITYERFRMLANRHITQNGRDRHYVPVGFCDLFGQTFRRRSRETFHCFVVLVVPSIFVLLVRRITKAFHSLESTVLSQ